MLTKEQEGEIMRKSWKTLCTLKILFIVAALLAGCDKSGEVLATYNVGETKKEITRKELRWLLKLQSQGSAYAKASTAQQQNLLKNYGLALIAHEEAKDWGLEKEASFQEAAAFLGEQAKLAGYELYLRDKNAKSRFDFVNLQLLILQVEGTDEKKVKLALQEREKEADALLKKLNSGKMSPQEIEEEIYQSSEHPRYRLQGGYLDPICVSCPGSALDKVLENLQKVGKLRFVKVVRPNAVWLVRLLKEYSLDEDELQGSFETLYSKTVRVAHRNFTKSRLTQKDGAWKQLLLSQADMEKMAKQRSDWLVRNQKRNLSGAKIEQMKKKKGLVLHDAAKNNTADALAELKPHTVLYSLEEKDYTYKDLKKDLEGANLKKPAEELQVMRTILLPIRLLAGEKDFATSQKSAIFAFVKNYMYGRQLLYSFYHREQENLQVPQEEIRKHYESQKQARFKKMAYKKAIEILRGELRKKKLGEHIKQAHKEWEKKYQLRIHNELLAADKV